MMNKNIILKLLSLISVVAMMIAIPVVSVFALTYENSNKKVDIDESTMEAGGQPIYYNNNYSLEYKALKNKNDISHGDKDSFAVIRIGLGGVNLSNKQVRWRIKGSNYCRIQFGFMDVNGNTVFVKRSDNTDGGSLDKFNVYKVSNITQNVQFEIQVNSINGLGIRYDLTWGDCYFGSKEAVAADATGQFKGYDGNGYKTYEDIDFSNIDTALIEFPTNTEIGTTVNIFSIEAKDVSGNGTWEKIFDAENCNYIEKMKTDDGANTDGYYKQNDYSFGTRPTFDVFTMAYGQLTALTKNMSIPAITGNGHKWTKAAIGNSQSVSLDETNALVMDLNTIGCATFNVHFIFRHITVNNAQVDYKAFGKGYYVDENGTISQVVDARSIKPNFKGRLLIPFSSFKEDGGSTLDKVTGKSATHLFFAWETGNPTVNFDMSNLRFVDVDFTQLENDFQVQLKLAEFAQTFKVEENVTIKISDTDPGKYGIRFGYTMDKTSFENLKQSITSASASYKLGALITRTDILGENELNLEFTGTKADVQIDLWQTENEHFTVAVFPMNDQNLSKDYITRAYLTVTYLDGRTETVYTDSTQKSVKAVAQDAIDANTFQDGSAELNVLNGIINLCNSQAQS